MIRRVLIANRGEIARRVIRTCRAMNIKTVAVFSEADADTPHVREADEAVGLGRAPATESYLNISKVIDAARRTAADAVHPGYGFLSENPAFVEACEAAGLIFVGPPGSVLREMGSKTGTRAAVAKAGVPVVPGATPRSQESSAIGASIREVGLPVMLKASGGGGGKGMRIVRRQEEIDGAIESARGEARRSFGNDALYVERLIERARHVEVQIFADRQGNAVHLFERDCTLQRRHQKVIEEAPAPTLTDALRDRLTQAALKVARTVGYVNAGTVEFLVDESGNGEPDFYFLEMNTRLQVEHPITEAITGLDLVRAQLQVADGEPLPFRQADIGINGHAIECRVYAEDPERLLPQSGRLLRYREPAGDGIRVDSGVVQGQQITVHYDPLIAKLIVHAPTRTEAIDRLLDAIGRFTILGIRHNLSFLSALLRRAEVASNTTHTRFIEEHLGELVTRPDPALRQTAAAIAARLATSEPVPVEQDQSTAAFDPWQTLGPVRW
ncbi:MAG TPA: biotin carboxylase N-terminal domain-containing protein [Vicinamibacterales bacterium]|nr:biotin carboxylase N-terminal domain-containing protein [Vicinamibacterales bacterium]